MKRLYIFFPLVGVTIANIMKYGSITMSSIALNKDIDNLANKIKFVLKVKLLLIHYFELVKKFLDRKEIG